MQQLLDKMFCKYCKDYNPRVAVVDSTNSTIKNAPYEYKNKDVLISPYQQGGRGRGTKSFLSEEGGAYFSIVYKVKDILPQDALRYVLIAGLGVEQTLSRLGVKGVYLKWPNDVYVQDKKISGILVEGVINAKDVEIIILGIGINIYNTPKLPIMTRLSDIVQVRSIPYIIAKTVQNIDNLINYPTRELVSQYKQKCSTIGKTVAINNTNQEGHVEDITQEGYLIVKTQEGNTIVTSGEIIIKE